MSSVAHRRRAIETRLGYPCEFRTGSNRHGDSPVELHGVQLYTSDDDQPFGRVAGGPTTLLGAGNDHHAALADAEETLRVRKVPEARATAPKRHYSGKHVTPERKVAISPELWARAQEYCAEHGTTFAAETRRHWEDITTPLDAGGRAVVVDVDSV